MTLLVDIGNSRIKWARLADGVIRDTGAASHRDADDARLAGTLPVPLPAGAEVLAASVADPALTQRVLRILAPPGVRVTLAHTEAAALGLHNGYQDPDQLGVDRWLAMLAAWGRFHEALCVADIGTAVTVDLIARDGRHLGGVIVPGPELMAAALHRETGRIAAAASRGRGERPAGAGADAFATDTDGCITLGGALAVAALIDRCFRSLAAKGSPGRLIVTGGGAPVVLRHLQSAADHRPLLVLEGLAVRYGVPAAAQPGTGA